MAAGSFELRAISIAAYAYVGDAEAGSVDGNESVDLALQAVVEKILGAAEVAETLFTGVSYECDRAGRLNMRVA